MTIEYMNQVSLGLLWFIAGVYVYVYRGVPSLDFISEIKDHG